MLITAFSSGGMTERQYAQYLEKAKITHPLGRHGEVTEVASVIVFLASKEASFMTGNLTPGIIQFLNKFLKSELLHFQSGPRLKGHEMFSNIT